MAALKFIVDLQAKLGNLPSAEKILGGLAQKLEQLDPGLKRTLRGFNLFGAGIGTALRGAQLGLGGLREGMNAAGRGVGRFATDALAHFTALASFNGLAMLARSALDLGKSLITTVANGERADAVLTALVGPDMFKRLDEWSGKLSKVTEFDDDDVKKFASGLLKVGMAADQLPVSLAIASDLAALTDTKDPTATLLGIGQALEKMQVKGGLDLRILNDAGISKKDFFGPLAKSMGIGMDEAEKEVADGKVSIDRLLEQLKKSITAKTGKGLGFTAIERGQGLSASLARLQRVPDDIFKSFKGTDASKDMAVSFERLAALLGPDGPVGSQIVKGIGTVFTEVAHWLSTTDFNKLGAQIVSFGESAKEVFSVVASAASWVWKAFDFVGTGIGEFVAEVYLEIEKLIGVGTQIGEFFGGLWVTINDWAGKLWEGAKSIGTKIWEGIKSGITDGIGKVGGAMGSMLSGLMGTTEDMLEIRSPSRVFKRYGALTGEGFAQGLAGSSSRIEGSAATAYDIAPPTVDIPSGGGATLTSRPTGDSRRVPPVINMPITINVTGSGGGETAREVAAAVEQLLPGQVQYAVERLLLEAGSAA